MTNNTSLLRAAAHPMNADGVKPLAPTLMCRAEKCEYTETVKALCCNGWLSLQTGTEGNHRAPTMKRQLRRTWLATLVLATALIPTAAFASMGGIDHLPDYLSVSYFSVNGAGGFQAGDGNASVPEAPCCQTNGTRG
jgi:hypothetical protein